MLAENKNTKNLNANFNEPQKLLNLLVNWNKKVNTSEYLQTGLLTIIYAFFAGRTLTGPSGSLEETAKEVINIILMYCSKDAIFWIEQNHRPPK